VATSSLQQLFVVISAHRLEESLFDYKFKQICHTINNPRQVRQFVTGKAAEHVIRRDIMERAAYPYPQPDEPPASQFLQKGTKTVMAGMPPLFLQFYPPEGDIEVIVDDNEVLDVNFMEIQGSGNGTPGKIHESLGLQKKKSLSMIGPLSIKAGKIIPGYRYSGIFGKSV